MKESSDTDILIAKIAETDEEKEQAFRLRYRVFAEEENNKRLANPFKKEWDSYDYYCDHLIVKNLKNDCVVGTYRLLPGKRAVKIGFYSETEFDLSIFNDIKSDFLELGRSCIDPQYRNGRTLQLLWEGIASYLLEKPHRYLIGCASLHLDNICEINQIYSYFQQSGAISRQYKISPHKTHRLQGLTEVTLQQSEKELLRKLPPLLKGYRWMGAEIGGEPAYDPIFDSIDFFIILEKDRLTQRYLLNSRYSRQ